MNKDDDMQIEIKGTIDLGSATAQENGLIKGSGEGEMILILKAEGQPIMKVKVHQLSFEGTSLVTDPDKYPDSSEK